MPKFVPRQRKHKARLRDEKDGRQSLQTDSNVEALQPLSKAEKEKERQRLKDVQQPKISAKKQKRLDKYIVRLLDLFFFVSDYAVS
jgi:ATP-dependent RNA helicase DHX37/DHR1